MPRGCHFVALCVLTACVGSDSPPMTFELRIAHDTDAAVDIESPAGGTIEVASGVHTLVIDFPSYAHAQRSDQISD